MSKNLSLVVCALVLAALACGTTANDLATVAVTLTPGTLNLDASPTPKAGSTTGPKATSGPAATDAPTDPPPTETQPAEDLQLGKFGFGQDGRQVGYAFLVENPNTGRSFESTQYHVAAYDAAGTVVETDSGYLSLILPGETTARSGAIFLDEGVTVDHIEVQLSPGDSEASDAIPSFGVASPLYLPNDFFPAVTAVLSSPYQKDVTDVQVSVVVYDSAGEIIGGGFTFVSFIPAGGQTGVHASVTADGQVDHVEVYPALSGLSLLTAASAVPSGAEAITLDKQGAGQDDTNVGVGFVVTNPNAGFAVENSRYRSTAYAADGSVLSTDEGYIHLLLPSETLGVGSRMLLGKGQTVDHVDVQILPGDYTTSDPVPSFTTDNVTYKPGQFGDSVTGEITSPYTKDISSLLVYALAYDADGKIIGGGFTFLDFVPAGGKAAVDVTVAVAGKPETVELYGAVSALSDIK